MLYSLCRQGVRFVAKRPNGQGVIFQELLGTACSLYSGVKTICTDSEMLLLTAAFRVTRPNGQVLTSQMCLLGRKHESSSVAGFFGSLGGFLQSQALDSFFHFCRN